MKRLSALLQHFKPNKQPKRELTTEAMSDQSIPHTTEACCQIAPVESSYQPKGKKVALSTYKDVYVVGPEDSKTAVIGQYNYLTVYLFMGLRGSSVPL
jgi:hypothetical protein